MDPRLPGGDALSTSYSHFNEKFMSVLIGVNEKLSQGDPVGALQLMLAVLQAEGYGDMALDVLERVRGGLTPGPASYQQATDDIANLFSQISLSQRKDSGASARNNVAPTQNNGIAPSEMELPFQNRPSHVSPNASILEETGRAGIADAALSDGSSFVCSYCGGVVKKDRESVHYELWCPARSGSG